MKVFEKNFYDLHPENLIDNFLPEEIDGFVVDSMSVL